MSIAEFTVSVVVVVRGGQGGSVLRMPSDGWEVRVRIRLLAAIVQAHVRRGHSGKMKH